MNLKCFLGFHDWKGTKCSRCGGVRGGPAKQRCRELLLPMLAKTEPDRRLLLFGKVDELTAAFAEVARDEGITPELMKSIIIEVLLAASAEEAILQAEVIAIEQEKRKRFAERWLGAG